MASSAPQGNGISKATANNKGSLRKELGAKPGKPIPAGKLDAAAKKSGKEGKRARLAQTLKRIGSASTGD